MYGQYIGGSAQKKRSARIPKLLIAEFLALNITPPLLFHSAAISTNNPFPLRLPEHAEKVVALIINQALLASPRIRASSCSLIQNSWLSVRVQCLQVCRGSSGSRCSQGREFASAGVVLRRYLSLALKKGLVSQSCRMSWVLLFRKSKRYLLWVVFWAEDFLRGSLELKRLEDALGLSSSDSFMTGSRLFSTNFIWFGYYYKRTGYCQHQRECLINYDKVLVKGKELQRAIWIRPISADRWVDYEYIQLEKFVTKISIELFLQEWSNQFQQICQAHRSYPMSLSRVPESYLEIISSSPQYL